MQKLSITQVADKFGISKEAVYNRIRRGTFQTTEEDGVKFIILDDEEKAKKSEKNGSHSAKTNTPNSNAQISKFVEYLLDEVSELKAKNEALLLEKEELHKQKEAVLIETKNEIKEIYEKRDEKLQYFMNLLQKPILPQTIDAKSDDLVEISTQNSEWISIGAFLKQNFDKKKERKKIKKLLLKNGDENVKFENGLAFVSKNLNITQIKEKI